MRQYAAPTPAATAAWKWDTPSRRSCAYRVCPFFHCRQIYTRNRRRIQASRFRSIYKLPENLTITGNLDLSDTPITSLPEGLKVSGNLDLGNTLITSLPDGLEVGGSLDLSDTPITSLPQGLKVSGDLYLEGSKVNEIPPAAKIGGWTIGLSGGMAEKFGRRHTNDIRNR
jgi:hypothetical protein